MKNKLMTLLGKYSHGMVIVVYMLIYLFWWSVLEQKVTTHYRLIHMAIDDYIPFVEVFVIPYFLWFAFIPLTVFYFMIKNKSEYYQLVIFLCTGMTIFLVISTLWPNGHHLRLSVMPRDNVFTAMISSLWSTDTPTNLWPSIHVYNSLGAFFAIIRAEELKKSKFIHFIAFLLTVSITLSTVLIKQHSMFDVLTALILGAVMYLIVYRFEWLTSTKKKKESRLRTS